MTKYSVVEINKMAVQMLMKAGASHADAETVSSHLIRADMEGYPSHGILRLPTYVQELISESISPKSPPEIQVNGPFISVDGNWGFGQVVAEKVTEIVIKTCEEYGLAVATVKNCHHIGRLYHYTEKLALNNLIGIMCVNGHGSGARVAAWNGRMPLLSTNPLSISLPTRHSPIVLDMSTSVVAEGKVRSSYNDNKEVPLGWIIDPMGNFTTNPSFLYENTPPGSLQPLGAIAGYKGFGLGLIVDILSGAITGANTTQPFGTKTRHGNGIFLVGISINKLVNIENYFSEVDAFLERIRQNAQMIDGSIVIIPGERSRKNLDENRVREINLSNSVITKLSVCCKKLDLPFFSEN